jgi:hypothetical protein
MIGGLVRMSAAIAFWRAGDHGWGIFPHDQSKHAESL